MRNTLTVWNVVVYVEVSDYHMAQRLSLEAAELHEVASSWLESARFRTKTNNRRTDGAGFEEPVRLRLLASGLKARAAFHLPDATSRGPRKPPLHHADPV